MTDKPERKRRDLTMGDRWRLELECVKPGESFLVLHIDGRQEGRVPIGNVLQIHARFDEGAADEAQQQIAMWRGRAGDWESKFYDKVVDQMRMGQLEGEAETAKRKQAAAESELAHLRTTIQPPGDPALEAQHRTLLSGVRSMLARCPRCHGSASVDGIPCPYCGVFRELVSQIDHRQEAAAEQAHVFLLHPGVSSGPYWEIANERDPEVIRLRAGGVYAGIKETAYGPLPVAWMRGRFMALEPAMGGGEVWTEATKFVEVDRERGLAACPEYLRERYRALAEGRR